MVTLARRFHHGHVFGLRDRDFGETNIEKWSTTEKLKTFTLQRHEIENYLLQPEVILNCRMPCHPKSIEECEIKSHSDAESQTSWLACRKILSELRGEIVQAFPSHPPCGAIRTADDATNRILNSPWLKQAGHTLSSCNDESKLMMKLHVAEQIYRQQLGTDDWKIHCSGKEVFKSLVDFVYQPRKGVNDAPREFAKSIGRTQADTHRVPTDLAHLLACLRFRVGLGPQSAAQA